jgi:UDP-hydrolysing UDP-N-acetyl-D-glucosamine 2-epimerase
MGEESWRVTFAGALSLDNARLLPRPTGAELRQKYDLDLRRPFLLVTLHPTTLGGGDSGEEARILIEALSMAEYECLCTQPNADPGSALIDAEFHSWAARDPARVRYAGTLGPNDFIAAMEHAIAMVGNSSAGIIEARNYGLPVVNVGDRQAGRLRGRNVLDVAASVGAIEEALRLAVTVEFSRQFEHDPNPYGDGHAAERIVAALVAAPPTDILLRKRFVDTPGDRRWTLPPLP